MFLLEIAKVLKSTILSTPKRACQSDGEAAIGPSATALQKWMKASGHRDASAWAPTTALYRSWASWCERTHKSRPFGPPLFGKALAHILIKQREQLGRGFRGFRLHAAEAGEPGG